MNSRDCDITIHCLVVEPEQKQQLIVLTKFYACN